MKKTVFKISVLMTLLMLLAQVPWISGLSMASPAQTGEQTRQTTAVAPGQMTDIHDIRQPEQWGVNPAWGVYGASGMAVLFCIIGIVWAVMQRRRSAKDITTIVPEISPEETAYGLLEDIKGLMQTDPKAYYFNLSEILRGYLEKRFQIDAMEMTSEELLPRLMGLDIENELKNDTKLFIRMSDPVKFADASADRAQMENHHKLVHTFVKKTTPGLTIPEQTVLDDKPLGKDKQQNKSVRIRHS